MEKKKLPHIKIATTYHGRLVNGDAVLDEYKKLLEKGFLAPLASVVTIDCIDDTQQLLKYSSTKASLFKDELKLRKSCKIDLHKGIVSKWHPIEVNSIQINLSSTEDRFVLLVLPNRFSVWFWSVWLQIAYDVWSGKDNESQLVGQSPFVVTPNCTCLISDDKKFAGRISIDLDLPDQLICNGEVISLSNMRSIIVSMDSVLPTNTAYELNLTSLEKITSSKESTKHLNLNPIKAAMHGASVAGHMVSGMARAAVHAVRHRHRRDHLEEVDSAIKSGKKFIVAKSEGCSFVITNEEDGRWEGGIILDTLEINAGEPKPGILLSYYKGGGHLVGDATVSMADLLLRSNVSSKTEEAAGEAAVLPAGTVTTHTVTVNFSAHSGTHSVYSL
ncbi:hypothetical protein EON65_28125 [archaeon]|nr:MAG: hypothetical protein EON65_28125 [archaeon]